MKRTLIALAAAALLAGCASTQFAGHAGYSVTPMFNADGTVAGCQLNASDGKEYSGRTIHFVGSACQLVVQEGESKAFKGQAIGAKAQAIFPVTDLANIIVGGEK